MLDKLLSSLQGIPAYSILISAVVVIFIAVSVLVMFGTSVSERCHGWEISGTLVLDKR